MKESKLKAQLSPDINEPHFYTLLMEAPVATSVYIGEEMIIAFANESMLRLWGKDASVLKKPLGEVLPELKEKPFYNILHDVFHTGVPCQTKEYAIDLIVEGQTQTCYFSFSYKPLRNDSGEVYGVLSMALDVTIQVHSRQKLKEAEERMRFALDSAEIGAWNFNPSNCQLDCNRRCKQLFGFSPQDNVLYSQILKQVHPHDIERVNEALSMALNPTSDGNLDLEFRCVGPEHNHVTFIRAKGKAYFDFKGVASRFAGTVVDVSKERAMHKEQQKLLTLVDNSSDLMSILEADGRNSYINKAGLELLGFDNEQQALQTPISSLHASEDFDLVEKEILPGVKKEGKWCGIMYVRHLKTGEVFPVYNSSIRIDDPISGEEVAVGAVMRDLRPEMAAQEALAESERMLRSITTASPAALWMSDETGKMTYVNETWVNWSGLAFEEHLGDGWLKAIVLEDRNRVASNFLSDLKARDVFETEFRINTPDGKVKWCISNGKPQFGADGSFNGYIGSCTDVTDLKNFERLLLESTNKLTDILEGLPQIAYTATPEGNINYFSHKWYDYTGLSAEDPVTSIDSTVVLEEDREMASNKWREDTALGRPHSLEVRLKRNDGVYRWHLSAALPIRNTRGDIVSWVGTLTDIHEQKELQRQKDDFLSIASHELKTPVTSIKAYTQVLESMFRKSGDSKKADMVLKMDGQINRLTNLITDLLDVTKINTGKLQFNQEYFDFNQMVQEIVEELQRTTDKHTIVEHFSETGYVYADKYRIGQVLTNFITNAIKYSPNADKIIVFTERKNNGVQCRVQDFGIGISENIRNKVFEQFYRVGGNVQYTFPGLGLGLYIAAQIIRRESGKIWVDSVEGQGSTFCFSIPLKKQSSGYQLE